MAADLFESGDVDLFNHAPKQEDLDKIFTHYASKPDEGMAVDELSTLLKHILAAMKKKAEAGMEDVKQEAIRAGRRATVIRNYMNEATKPYDDPIKLAKWSKQMHSEMDAEEKGLASKDAFIASFDKGMLAIITEIEKDD
eukprot:g4511.t1